MAPKKGKKKKAAEQAAELERLAEEQRLAAIAEAERQEVLRLEREEAERVRKVEEARLAAELEARLVEEDKENAPLYAEREQILAQEQQSALAHEEWNRYVQCNAIPEFTNQPEANAFLTDWQERDVGELDQTLAEAELGHQLITELQADAAAAVELRRLKQASWQLELLDRVRETALHKLDATCADLMQRADEYATAKNELLRCAVLPGCKFGIWVNLAKNPRVKSIDFPEIRASTELPKSLALASIALRMMHFSVDHVSPRESLPEEPPAEDAARPASAAPADVPSEEPPLEEAPVDPPPAAVSWLTVGGVLCMDLLTLPPPTKKVKGWTMRLITESSSPVNRQQYPVAWDAATLASTTPLRISYALPKQLLVPAEKAVGWFDPEEKQWKTDGISEVAFDEQTRQLSFLSARIATLALLQPSALELPYKNWLLTPLSHSHCRLLVQTQRHCFDFELSGRGCKLQGPRLPELSQLLDQPMAPTRLLLMLRDCGINLCPKDGDAPTGMTPKDESVERELHAAVVSLIPHLQLAPSRWNGDQGAGRCIFRMAPNKVVDADMGIGGDAPAATEPEDPFAAVEPSWQSMLIGHRYVALIKALDSDASCDTAVMPNMEAHSTPLLCVRGVYPDLVDELTSTSKFYLEQVRQMLNKLRLLSFTELPS